VEKLVAAIRKIDPGYGAEYNATTRGLKGQVLSLTAQGAQAGKKPETQQQQAAKKLSSFSTRVKDVLLKINEQVKKNGWINVQVFEKVDVNKNGIVERAEFIQFFAQSMQVKGLAIPQDVELLCDALDMNKDNLISVNEFCLCLEGVQHSLD
jgi:hypothetical protein